MLVVISLVIGLVGPFGTFEMPVVLRVAYWAAIVIGTYGIGLMVVGPVEHLLLRRLPRLAAAALAGAIAGIPIALAVVAINVGVFGPDLQPIDALSLTIYCALIATAVTVLTAMFERRAPEAAPAVSADDAGPVLLERLPLPQRGRLLHIEVADHYVDVHTDRGHGLLLMRLSDAIRETAPVAGLQVHRSHWVALDAVRRVTKQAGKPVLELETGAVVPVSRTYLSAARAAGLAL